MPCQGHPLRVEPEKRRASCPGQALSPDSCPCLAIQSSFYSHSRPWPQPLSALVPPCPQLPTPALGFCLGCCPLSSGDVSETQDGMLSFFKSLQEAGATESSLWTSSLANGSAEPHCFPGQKALVCQGILKHTPSPGPSLSWMCPSSSLLQKGQFRRIHSPGLTPA